MELWQLRNIYSVHITYHISQIYWSILAVLRIRIKKVCPDPEPVRIRLGSGSNPDPNFTFWIRIRIRIRIRIPNRIQNKSVKWSHISSRNNCQSEGWIRAGFRIRIRIRIRISLSCWIRIRIHIQIADPDPGMQKWQKKLKKGQNFHLSECWMFSFEGWRLLL